MLEQVSVWRGWKWEARIDDKTPSGRLLLRLTKLMSLEADLRETGIVVFGSAPLEFCAMLGVRSADIDVTPNQFLEHLRNRVKEWGLASGDPYVQVLPPTVFRPGKNYLVRASLIKSNGIDVIIPHPIDIVFGKLHRMDTKDYTAINELLNAFQRPTIRDLDAYMVDNPDIFEGLPESAEKLAGNVETLWSYLGGGSVDVREKFIKPALEQQAAAWEEGNGNLSKARDLGDFGKRDVRPLE